MGDEGTAVKPRRLEILLYEDRHGNHVIRVESNRGRFVHRQVVSRDSRAPLSASCAILKNVLEELGE